MLNTVSKNQSVGILFIFICIRTESYLVYLNHTRLIYVNLEYNNRFIDINISIKCYIIYIALFINIYKKTR